MLIFCVYFAIWIHKTHTVLLVCLHFPAAFEIFLCRSYFSHNWFMMFPLVSDSNFYSTSFPSPVERWRRGRWREPVFLCRQTVGGSELSWPSASPYAERLTALFCLRDFLCILPQRVPHELQRIFKSVLDCTSSLSKLYIKVISWGTCIR